MKYLKPIAAIILFIAVNQLSAQSVSQKWPAMKSFHEVISRVYHPAEEGNFAPVKENAETIMMRAEALSANVPKEFRNETILASVAKLQEQSKTVHKLVVGQGSGDMLMEALKKVHDTFNQLVAQSANPKK